MAAAGAARLSRIAGKPAVEVVAGKARSRGRHESASVGEEALSQLQDRAAQARRARDLHGRAAPQAAARVSARTMRRQLIDRLNRGASAARLGALFWRRFVGNGAKTWRVSPA